MADLMDMRWLVRDINQRAVDEVRIQHIFTPGLPDEIRREKIRRRKFAKAENRIPFYFLLDITYIWASFLSVIVSLIYFLMFFTLLGWTHSMSSFAGNVAESNDMVESEGYRMRVWAGYYLFMFFFLFGISWFSLFGAGFVGRRSIYIISLAGHFFILLTEIFAVVSALTYLPTRCDTSVLRERMFNYFIWYGILAPHRKNHGHEAMSKMDVLQMACCGIDGYKDYEKLFATEGDPSFNRSWYPPVINLLHSHHIYDLSYYIQNGREVRQLPPSCCTPFWRQNVYCADDIFIMERTLDNSSIANDRLNLRGCVQAVEETCERFISLMTSGMLAIVILRAFICILKVIITGIILRSMHLIMTTLFSVTRGNVRFIYDYRKTNPDEDPYKRALEEFRRGVVPLGWEEYVENRIEGRRKVYPISERFTVAELAGTTDKEDKVYQEMIRRWPEANVAGKELYFGTEGPPNMKESEFLDIRGQQKEIRQAGSVFMRLAQMETESRAGRRSGSREPIDKPLKIKKLPTRPVAPTRTEENPKMFEDKVDFVPIPEDTSPVERLIEDKQKEAKRAGIWKRKFRQSALAILAFNAESRERDRKSKESKREFPTRRANDLKLNRRPATAPPSVTPSPTPGKPKPRKEHAGKTELQARLPEPPTPEEKPKRRRSPIAEKKSAMEKHEKKESVEKPRKLEKPAEQKHHDSLKPEHKKRAILKPKLESTLVKSKTDKDQSKKKEKTKKLPKKHRSKNVKRSKSKPREYKPYETGAKVEGSSKKLETIKDSERRQMEGQEIKKRTVSLPILTGVSSKKKKRKRKKRHAKKSGLTFAPERKHHKTHHQPWNYGLTRRSLVDP